MPFIVILMGYYNDLTTFIKDKKPGKERLNKFKIWLCKKYHLARIPKDIDIILSLPEHELKKVKKYLLTKPVRTLSGVAVVAMMAEPRKCMHGTCTFCPGGPGSVFGDVPQSYTGKEPSTMRSLRNSFDPYLIMMNRLEQYISAGHLPEKVEVIIQGGTFPSYPRRYQETYVTGIFKAMNDFSMLFFPKHGDLSLSRFKKFFELPGDIRDPARAERLRLKLSRMKLKSRAGLENEQLRNEKSRIKCVGLTVETNPQYGRLGHGNFLLKLGVTRIELGVQTLYDAALRKTNRGHGLGDTIQSIATLRDLGFKLNFHIMLGLPGVTKKMDAAAMRMLFRDAHYQPDMLKIYPCMVMQGTELYKDWKAGRYRPLTTKEAADLIAEFKRHVPEYCRIMRVQRDIPTYVTAAGVDRTNLRQYVEQAMKKKKIHCRCIRCREIGRNPGAITKIQYLVRIYPASGGTEFFIEAMSKDRLLGFCRLRFPFQSLRKEIANDSAIVRELHVFGEAVALGKKGRKSAVQHRGIGKRLMAIAEQLARQYLKTKMVVISGVGVRDYYRKMGYKKEGVYMVKGLS